MSKAEGFERAGESELNRKDAKMQRRLYNPVFFASLRFDGRFLSGGTCEAGLALER
jgi:hypothetical protein